MRIGKIVSLIALLSSSFAGVAKAQYYTAYGNNGYIPQQQVPVAAMPAGGYPAQYMQQQYAQPQVVVQQPTRVTNPLNRYGQIQYPWNKNGRSDLGLYLGVGFAQGKDGGTGMTSSIEDSDVPGNWAEGGNVGSSSSFMFNVGTYVSSDFRLELSYTTYSGLAYGDYATQFDETCSEQDEIDGYCSYNLEYTLDEGGNISSEMWLASFIYSLENMFGSFMGGSITPYMGFGFGVAYNAITDFALNDPDGWEDDGDCPFGTATVNGVDSYSCGTAYSAGEVTHIGASMVNFTWALELGVTMSLEESIYFDFFYRRSSLGRVKTSGNIFANYATEDIWILDEYQDVSMCDSGYDGDNNTYVCYTGADDYYDMYTGQPESGELLITEMGVKIRALF